MHPDQRALLDNILANPDDDVARLVYADWLQESGQEARAEFIQSQIAMSGKHCSGGNLPANKRSNGMRRCRCQWCQNYRRGQLLLQEHYSEWFRYAKTPSTHPTSYARIDARWNQGFVDRVICTFNSWFIYVDDILAEHPIQKVRFSTRVPGDLQEHPDKKYWFQFVWHPSVGDDTTFTDISPEDRENPSRDDVYETPETWGEIACRLRWPGPASQPIQYYRA